jgi:selenocysteine-specific elongation factor
LGTAEEGAGFAELVFETPLFLCDGDRLVLRDDAKRLFGARAVSLDVPRRGKRDPEFLAWLSKKSAALGSDEDALRVELERGSVRRDRFLWERQLPENWFDSPEAASFIRAGDDIADARLVEQAGVKILAALDKFHRQTPDAPGAGADRLLRMAMPGESKSLFSLYLSRLADAGNIVSSNGFFRLARFQFAFDAREERLWERAAPLFEHAPVWVRDAAPALGLSEDDARAFLRKAAALGKIVAVVRDRYFLMEQIASFAAMVRDGRAATAAALRDRLGVGRKVAVQILEYFDRCGFTRRVGDEHVVRDGEMFLRKR